MAKKIITLYVSDTSIKLLETRGNRVKKWVRLPLESGLVKDGVIVNETEVVAKIKEVIKAQKVKVGKVIVGLSGLHCLFRVIDLPQLPETMLVEAIGREAARLLPVPPEQLYLSWQVIPSSGEGIQVFLAALPRNAVDVLIKTLRQVGVKPYLMDLTPLALARVIDTTPAIIVDVRSTEVDIVIMVEGVPQLIRSLALPGESVSPQEKLSAVREELERTIKFYNSSYPEKPLESSIPIFVSGELADEPELDQSLVDGLGSYNVLPLSSPLKCPQGLILSQCMVNVGLALKELSVGKRASPSVVNLNVLPEVYRVKGPSLIKILAPIGIIAVVALLFSQITLIRGATDETILLQKRLNVFDLLLTEKDIEQQSQDEQIAELEEKVVELEVTNNTFDTAFSSLSIYQEKVNGDLGIAIATSTLPTGVDLTGITHIGVALTVRGMSSSGTEVLTYANALRDTDRFSQVTISNIEKIEDKINFTLTLWVRE
ncbi:pilus assembly protein PilM [Chloroflexota bacterium]